MQSGTTVEISFSEPWDLVNELGASSFAAKVVRIAPDLDSALIQLVLPIHVRNQYLDQMISSPRYAGDRFTPLTSQLTCGFIAADSTSAPNFETMEVRKLTSWFQAIGTITRR